jgi:hypothetical protein
VVVAWHDRLGEILTTGKDFEDKVFLGGIGKLNFLILFQKWQNINLGLHV